MSGSLLGSDPILQNRSSTTKAATSIDAAHEPLEESVIVAEKSLHHGHLSTHSSRKMELSKPVALRTRQAHRLLTVPRTSRFSRNACHKGQAGGGGLESPHPRFKTASIVKTKPTVSPRQRPNCSFQSQQRSCALSPTSEQAASEQGHGSTFRLSERALCSKMLVISVTVFVGFPMSNGSRLGCPPALLSLAAGSNLLRSSLTCITKARHRQSKPGQPRHDSPRGSTQDREDRRTPQALRKA